MSHIDNSWRDKYKKKIVSAEEAVQKIRNGMGIAITNTSDCLTLMNPLTKREDLEDVRLYIAFGPPDSPFADPEKLMNRFKIYSYFLNNVTVPSFEKGFIDFIPAHNSMMYRQFTHGHVQVDAAMVSMTPPDRNGFLSLSYRPEMHKPVIPRLKAERGDNFLVIAAVNENLPFCCGDTLIHVSEIDFMVEDHHPMKPMDWYREEELDEEIAMIARNVAALVEDGATLEFGIGKVPPHICRALMNKNDLGIHTEILSAPVFDLIKAGVVTGKRKILHPYQVVFGFAIPASMEMYEWFDCNPVCTAYPLYYVCDPNVVSKNYKFTAINTAVQIDLTGQDNSEVIFSSQWSGTGGHTDYMRGACLSNGGRAIVALQSTAKGGSISRIVGGPLYAGGVTTGRNDIQYVVTEYGIAKLEGRGLRERAHALIDISHPKFRDELRDQAKERHLW